MRKVLLYFCLLLLPFSCKENNVQPDPVITEDPLLPLELRHLTGQWGIIKTDRKTFNTQNIQIAEIKRTYEPGKLYITFAFQDRFTEVLNDTAVAYGSYSLIIPPYYNFKQSYIRLTIWQGAEAWTHNGNYYVDSLYAKRLVRTDTLNQQGVRHINTTTAIRLL